MARRLVTVSRAVFRAADVTWDIDWRGQSAGDATDGTTQTVFNAFPRWVGRPRLHLTGARLLAWRAIRAHAQGRAGVLRVPMEDFAVPQPPPARPGLDLASSGWSHEPVVVASGAASAGAEEIVVDEGAQAVTVGQMISADDWPMVVTSRQVSGGLATLTVQPPLRAALADGALIHLRAWGRFEMVDDLTGAPVQGMRPWSQPEVGLREVLTR